MTVSELINRLLEFSIEPNAKVINTITGTELKDIGTYSHQSNKFPMEVHLKFYEEKANSENILNIGDRISAIIEDSVNKK